MVAELTTSQVWDEVQRANFAVIGMVSAAGHARTAGVIYSTDRQRLYVPSARQAWKTRHMSANPHVSVTVTVPQRVLLMPWLTVPPATITFNGTARVLSAADLPAGTRDSLVGNLVVSEEHSDVIIEITPTGDFVTYGVGVPLRQMRDTTLAAGRARVSEASPA